MRELRKIVMRVYERALARSGPAPQPAAEEAPAQPVKRKRKRMRASVGTTCICCDLHGLLETLLLKLACPQHYGWGVRMGVATRRGGIHSYVDDVMRSPLHPLTP